MLNNKIAHWVTQRTADTRILNLRLKILNDNVLKTLSSPYSAGILNIYVSKYRQNGSFDFETRIYRNI